MGSQIDFAGGKRSAAFPLLTDEQIALFRRFGQERAFAAGEIIFRPGDPTTDFIVVLEGRIAIVDDHGRPDERLIVEHGPRSFLGEFNAISGQPTLFTAIARADGRALTVPLHDLRALIASQSTLSNVVLGALLGRRALLISEQVGARIIGSRYSPDTRRLLEFASRNRLPHAWLDVENDPEVEELLRALDVSPDEMPVVLLGDHVFNNPTNQEFARLLGFVPPPDHHDVYDLLVIGGGPAGLAAAVYGASEGLSTLLLESVAVGGQAGTSSRIENYLGFPAGISGAELAARAAIQAEKFEARLTYPCEAVALESRDGLHLVRLSDGDEVVARAVILATGARYRRLPLERLEELEGFGVYYAATPVEARMCAGSAVFVVGGGNSAGQAALFSSSLPIFAGLNVPLVVCGHTHMQFDRRIGKVRVVNAGSVGMPFGEPGAYWLLLGPNVQLRHTSYDLTKAAERIQATSYPQAQDFAAKNILQPPSEEETLESFAKVELR